MMKENNYLELHYKKSKHSIHRLVDNAYIANPYNKPQVNHINCKKLDNRLENLRLLCPNCHSITPTWRYKNNKNNKKQVINPIIKGVRGLRSGYII